MNHQLQKLIEEKKKQNARDIRSIQCEYDDFLFKAGVNPSCYGKSRESVLRGRRDISLTILEFNKKAVLGNERIALINDLYQTGYNPHEVIKLILKEFNENSESTYLWEYGDLLYRIHDKDFLKEYCLIASNQSFGTARQMIILLIGECKDPSVIEILIDLLSDDDVRGHALEALSHFRDIKVYNIMKLYADCQTKWIRNVAISYLKHFD